MAIINLDVDKIMSLSNEIVSLDTALTKSYFPELQETIMGIRHNVLNSQITDILNNIDSQVNSINSDLSSALPKLEQFLEDQMKSYSMSEQEALENLNRVMSQMGAIAGVTYTAPSNGGSTGGTTTGGTTTGGTTTGGTTTGGTKKEEKGWWDRAVDRQSDNWDFSDCDGIVDHAVAVVDGAVSTVVDVGLTVLDGAGQVVGGIIEGAGKAVSWIGDGIQKIFSW